MDIVVYTNGEQYYYDSGLRKIISKGNLKKLFNQKDANINVIDMSLYKEQTKSFSDEINDYVFKNRLFIPYNPLKVERANDRIFMSDGAVTAGGVDFKFKFGYEKINYAWPERDNILNEKLSELYLEGVPTEVVKDDYFIIDLLEDTDFPTIEVQNEDKVFSHLVRLSKGKYKFHVRFTPNKLGNKHNYNSEGAIKRCNDLSILCSRDEYSKYIDSWTDAETVFTYGFNDIFQIDFVTTINTNNDINRSGSIISSSTKHIDNNSIDFDNIIDYAYTYSNNTRVGRKR